MKIASLFCFGWFICGSAFALSQDWPCFEFKMKKTKTIREDSQGFEYSYSGEKNGYLLTVNLLGDTISPTSFANCGTTGCQGSIMEIKTGKTDAVRLDCFTDNENYENVQCNITGADEFIFHKENGEYVVNYCSNEPQRTLRFKISDCKGCHCKMFWYNGDKRNIIGHWEMGCIIQENQAHCFSYNGYEEWRKFENKEQDFQNCIGMMTK